MRVIVAIPHGAHDDGIVASGSVARSVMAFQNWLAEQTGGSKLPFKTENGNVSNETFRLAATDATIRAKGAYVRDHLEEELKKAHDPQHNVVYAVSYTGSSTFACGGGAWPPELPGTVAAMYLKGEPPGAPTCATNELGADVNAPGYLDFARSCARSASSPPARPTRRAAGTSATTPPT